MTDSATRVSLADFAASWREGAAQSVPEWVVAGSTAPAFLQPAEVRHRIESVLDTVTALQRAEYLEDGVYLGPQSMPEVYRELLSCARVLEVPVPPAVMAGVPMKSQGTFGTDAHGLLVCSSYYFHGASPAAQRFQLGRMVGQLAARQVTASSLYAVLVDQAGLRAVARRAVGPLLEVVLAPVSLGARVALSRWHRAAELSADRAGLLCAGTLDASGEALMKIALGMTPKVGATEYMAALRRERGTSSPGRWAELLAGQPFVHKRLLALDLFARSELFVRLGGQASSETLLTDEQLAQRTRDVLAVG